MRIILNLGTVFKYNLKIKYYCIIAGLFFTINVAASIPYMRLMPEDSLTDDTAAALCTAGTSDLEYSYSQLSASLFKYRTPTPLPPVSQTWQVVCSAPVTAMYISVDADQKSDNQSSSNPTYFGLGSVNGQGTLGYYQVMLTNATVDGLPAKLYQTHAPGQPDTAQTSLLLKSTMLHGWTQDSHHPAKGQQYSVQLTIMPTLNSLQETRGPLVNGGALNGELSLSFPFSE